MTAPRAEPTIRAETNGGRTEATGVGAERCGMRLSVGWGIGIMLFIVGCDSNPTPHPQNPDVKNEDAIGGHHEPDRDNEFASGDAGDAYDGDGGPPWTGAEGDACGEVSGDAGPHLDNGRDDVAVDAQASGEEACPGSDDQSESGDPEDDDDDGSDSGGRGSSNEPSYGGPPRPIGSGGSGKR